MFSTQLSRGWLTMVLAWRSHIALNLPDVKNIYIILTPYNVPKCLTFISYQGVRSSTETASTYRAFSGMSPHTWGEIAVTKTLPKAQRTQGLSSTYQSNFFGSYHKFKHKSWSNIFRISTLHQLQNLNQTSPFWQNLNLKILTKQNQNLDKEWTS